MRISAPAAISLLQLAAATAALAQQSSGYVQDEHVLNSGGDPAGGAGLSSPSYRIGLDAIGDAVGLTPMQSPGFQLGGGFVPAYLPPGEVLGLRVQRPGTTLTWLPEPSTGTYSVYRGLVSELPLLEYGSCLAHGMTLPGGADATPDPPPGQAYFYLVTAENRIAEEGTKGSASSGAPRPNPAPCP